MKRIEQLSGHLWTIETDYHIKDQQKSNEEQSSRSIMMRVSWGFERLSNTNTDILKTLEI